jgi:hypothetical protein
VLHFRLCINQDLCTGRRLVQSTRVKPVAGNRTIHTVPVARRGTELIILFRFAPHCGLRQGKTTRPMSDHLYYGDNLQVLRDHVKDESVDLIYLGICL